MLTDSGNIQENDTRIFNKKRAKQNKPPVEPLYDKEDAMACMELFIGIPYDRNFRIDENTTLKFTNTGHLLGSGVANIQIKEGNRVFNIAYTGDIGRPVNRILAPPKPFPQADLLITESTYGDRLHQDTGESDKELLNILNRTCVEKKGKLIIPSFSIGRTQEIVYSLNNFYNQGRLPRINIYVDSPLAVNATDIFRLHPECFNKSFMELMDRDPDPFGFNKLLYIKSAEDSKKLNNLKEPCVIISASGMMEAGRIKHHLANNISDPANTILAVGYCAPSTLGAKILRGDKEVSIYGNIYKVNAEVRQLESFSGHGDYRELLHFLQCQNKNQLRMTFLVHGEYEVQQKYKAYLESAGFDNIRIPSPKEEFEF
jgi:metallo-beta-lactamase family protein